MSRYSEVDETRAYFSVEIDEMLSQTRHCLNCGKELRLKYEWAPDSKINRGYCCRKCFVQKSPLIAYLEKTHGIPIRELMLQLLKRHSISIASDMLGITRDTFYRHMAKLKIKRGRWE